MSNLYRGPSIDASYQISVHMVEGFQRRRSLKVGQSETRIACGSQVFNGSGQNVQSLERTLISKKSFPLKQLGQMNQNLVGSIFGRSSIKIAHLVPIR
jgi:hypothetical protein